MWLACIIVVMVVIRILFETCWQSVSHRVSLAQTIDDGQHAPFGFANYPFDTPFELRDISNYSTIIAIGDLHGELDQAIKILQMSGIVDAHLNFVAQDTILVQTGDLMKSIETKLATRHKHLSHLSAAARRWVELSRANAKTVSETITILTLVAIHESIIEGHGFRPHNNPRHWNPFIIIPTHRIFNPFQCSIFHFTGQLI